MVMLTHMEVHAAYIAADPLMDAAHSFNVSYDQFQVLSHSTFFCDAV